MRRGIALAITLAGLSGGPSDATAATPVGDTKAAAAADAINAQATISSGEFSAH